MMKTGKFECLFHIISHLAYVYMYISSSVLLPPHASVVPSGQSQADTSAVPQPGTSGTSGLSCPGPSRRTPPGPRELASQVFEDSDEDVRYLELVARDDNGGDEVFPPLSPASVKRGSNHYQTEMFFHERRLFIRR